MFEPKTRESSLSVRVLYRNRSGVVELLGREPLIFARVENGVTKFSPKKRKRQNFKFSFWIRNSSFQTDYQYSMGNFHFFGRGVVQARRFKKSFFIWPAPFFQYNKRLLRQNTGGACLYMPQDGHWLASFEVIPPQKLVFPRPKK